MLTDDEAERPPSPSLLREEDGSLQTLFECKAKLLFNINSSWSERGVGTLLLQRPTDGGAARLVMRNDTGKLMLNASLYRGIKPLLRQRGIVLGLHVAKEGSDAVEKVTTCAPAAPLSSRA